MTSNVKDLLSKARNCSPAKKDMSGLTKGKSMRTGLLVELVRQKGLKAEMPSHLTGYTEVALSMTSGKELASSQGKVQRSVIFGQSTVSLKKGCSMASITIGAGLLVKLPSIWALESLTGRIALAKTHIGMGIIITQLATSRILTSSRIVTIIRGNGTR